MCDPDDEDGGSVEISQVQQRNEVTNINGEQSVQKTTNTVHDVTILCTSSTDTPFRHTIEDTVVHGSLLSGTAEDTVVHVFLLSGTVKDTLENGLNRMRTWFLNGCGKILPRC